MHFNWRKAELTYKSVSYGAGSLLPNCPETSPERGLWQTQVTSWLLHLAFPGDLIFGMYLIFFQIYKHANWIQN